ncbi:hypothetical protein AU252_15510 [Pseudarthrobacter sulfonivorans]|uniref:Uncharacterized protein n=1 Tax=Pseudarthrobacter sulfonivorans TaxID=121292 RepID=A0A0U3QZV2_9MICC|nr:hypothetical protein [Pseudarthrobacter sulfonivorans]ALV42380.1 hypothetical protein AU252_15510 [Pseudarthrobacter sulfonivorans]
MIDVMIVSTTLIALGFIVANVGRANSENDSIIWLGIACTRRRRPATPPGVRPQSRRTDGNRQTRGGTGRSIQRRSGRTIRTQQG